MRKQTVMQEDKRFIHIPDREADGSREMVDIGILPEFIFTFSPFSYDAAVHHQLTGSLFSHENVEF